MTEIDDDDDDDDAKEEGNRTANPSGRGSNKDGAEERKRMKKLRTNMKRFKRFEEGTGGSETI